MLWLLENWKKVLAALACLVLVAGSFWAGRRSVSAPAAPAVAQIDQHVKEDVATSSTTKTTTTTVNKDGTSTTVVQEKIDTKDSKTQIDTKTKAEARAKYRVGAAARVTPADLKAGQWKPDYSVTGGVRLIDRLWLDAQYGLGSKTFGLGLSLEF